MSDRPRRSTAKATLSSRGRACPARGPWTNQCASGTFCPLRVFLPESHAGRYNRASPVMDLEAAFHPASTPDYLPPVRMRELQLERLRAVVRRAYGKVPLFRARLDAREGGGGGRLFLPPLSPPPFFSFHHQDRSARHLPFRDFRQPH